MALSPPGPHPRLTAPGRAKRGFPLSLRLALLFVATGLVPLGMTLLVLAPRGQDALRTSAKLLHQAELEAVRVRLDRAFDDLLADIRWLGTPRKTIGPETPERLSAERAAELRFLLQKHAELTSVTLYDGAQKVAGGQAYDRALMDSWDLQAHELQARRLSGRGLRVSEFYSSNHRQEMLVTISVPYPPAGAEGRLAAEVSLKTVQELIAQTRVGRRGSAFIVDDRGRLVAHRDLKRVLARENLSSMSVVAQLRENIARAAATGRPLTVVTDFSDDGVEQVGAYAPLGMLRWGVVTEEPREDAYGLARATWAHAAGWTSLALALAVLVAVFFARNITGPVARLVEGTQVLARGDFSVSVPVGGPPEISELARTFNEAARQLQRYDKENKELFAAVERGYLETLRALVNAIDAKDPYTAGHSQRTAELSVAIARALGLPPRQLDEIQWGGLLHDIGKIGIPENILRKPAALEPEEMNVMRTHPSIGGAMTHGVEFLERINAMIRSHHERYDGSGYPDGLAGDDIPLAARIVAVADTYDAINSDRCYQPGRPPADTMIILNRLAGTTLDAEVVRALGRALVELGAIEESKPHEVLAQSLPPLNMDDDEDERTGRIELEEKN
jgi:putative nucleotidyltransferase with HDIG domain